MKSYLGERSCNAFLGQTYMLPTMYKKKEDKSVTINTLMKNLSF